jgi:hypothetical protein
MFYIGSMYPKSSYVYVTDGRGRRSRARKFLQIKMAIGSISAMDE